MTKYPNFNWVICHSPYSVGFDGVQGTDWGYTHHELKISFYRTIGSVTYLQYFLFYFSHNLLYRYDLYWARSGTFYRYGNGGFINACTLFSQTCNSTMISFNIVGIWGQRTWDRWWWSDRPLWRSMILIIYLITFIFSSWFYICEVVRVSLFLSFSYFCQVFGLNSVCSNVRLHY